MHKTLLVFKTTKNINMKIRTLLLGISILLTVSVFAQPVEVDAEFGDGTRSVLGVKTIDFGIISDDYAETVFDIKNNKPTSMKIVSFSFTGGGVGVVLKDKVIEGKSNAEIIVSVYPNYIKNIDENNEFELYMLIVTEGEQKQGLKIIEESIYRIKGKIEQ